MHSQIIESLQIEYDENVHANSPGYRTNLPLSRTGKQISRIKASSTLGESLFTLFASLTYAYHYLMTLIK